MESKRWFNVLFRRKTFKAEQEKLQAQFLTEYTERVSTQ
ncbi:hypothetical protein KIPB_013785, partial [Kipferlia bialata]|eukprot:g13785.t1